MKTKVKHCPKNNKVCFPSESSAQRRVNKYEDIKRVYLCECGSWHLTSSDRPKRKSKVKLSEINKRIKGLKKRISKNENENTK